MFDRFTAEEQYSWIVRSVAPNALRVLDMQDCHALRLWREHCILKGSTPLPEILSSVPDATWPLLQRELEAMNRILHVAPSTFAYEAPFAMRTFGIPSCSSALACSLAVMYRTATKTLDWTALCLQSTESDNQPAVEPAP